MIKVALLSRWHVHADDYARGAKANDQISIELVWDEDAERGKQWADELGVPFEQELESVLANPEIDAVIVTTPTNLHTEVMVAAANHKKHIFTEKVLAFSTEACEQIYQAVEEQGVKLMVSLPKLTDSPFVYAEKALQAGKLGKLTTIRCRFAHNGAVAPEGQASGWLPERFFNLEETGGGALMDLGAHPIYLTNRLAGKATAVQARLQEINNHGVDDNAVVLVEYESGALGIIETSFVSHGSPFQLELYGTEGSIMIEEGQIRLSSRHGDEVISAETVSSLPMPMEQWVQAIQNETTPSITKEDVLNLTLINEAAAKSHQEKTRVELS
ncbi:Gfo/Idh/MocA family protein [Bacillus sp. FSL K6-3431]|uniref:Gfo/Idh/MocA family protein n=1 Tax=Bacillus sp. FSL K6-3431 TaxID=2921500 RepID=UPI0030F74687